MSMAKCKCDKIFDTDEELDTDENGNCCCDNCFEIIYTEMVSDIGKMLDNIDSMDKKYPALDIPATMTDYLITEGYRKVN